MWRLRVRRWWSSFFFFQKACHGVLFKISRADPGSFYMMAFGSVAAVVKALKSTTAVIQCQALTEEGPTSIAEHLAEIKLRSPAIDPCCLNSACEHLFMCVCSCAHASACACARECECPVDDNVGADAGACAGAGDRRAKWVGEMGGGMGAAHAWL